MPIASPSPRCGRKQPREVLPGARDRERVERANFSVGLALGAGDREARATTFRNFPGATCQVAADQGAAPGALMIARGLDTVSVSLDPSTLARTTVLADPGMVLGVKTDCVFFSVGMASRMSF